MTDALQVRLHPADSHGCGFYRMRQPALYAGILTKESARIERSPKGGVATYDADVFVFQRPMDYRMPEVIVQLQKQGVAVVVELDDDLASLDPHHVVYAGSHPRLNPGANWKHLKHCCSIADLVTCTTPELAARFAGHGRAYVIPNFIESRVLEIESLPEADFGWTGSVPSHPHDLQELGVAVRDLVAEGNSFRIVGDGIGVKDVLSLAEDPDSTGWLDLDDYYTAIGRIGVGLVPLRDSVFNRGKSWLKGLEYAALGVPFVASPTPDYKHLASILGDGIVFAEKPKHWRSRTRTLLNTDLSEISLHLRERVRTHLTIEANAWRWADAWTMAAEYRHTRGRKAA